MEEKKTAKGNKEEKAMRGIMVGKLTLNIGAGKDQATLDKGVKLIKNLCGVAPVKIASKKRIPTWGVRPGLPVGCKVTLRGKKAKELISRLLDARSNVLEESCFDENGNVAFGINEYIDIKDAKYDPEIGIMGLQACITLERPGFRIKKRRVERRKLPGKHRIKKDEAVNFMKSEFNVKVGEEE